jgi:hypothetical protein
MSTGATEALLVLPAAFLFFAGIFIERRSERKRIEQVRARELKLHRHDPNIRPGDGISA